MDRICPFLALSTDHRTVVDGFDSDHACHALETPELLDRSRQAQLCLAEAHRQCDRYEAFLTRRAGDAPSAPAPAADALIARTRLILDPEARRGGGTAFAPLGLSPRRWLVAGSVAAVGVAVAATAAGGGFNGLVGRAGPSGSAPAVTVASTPTQPAVGTPPATPLASPEPSPVPVSPTPTSTPAGSTDTGAAPTTYTVQRGDTLSLIATRFGTSVSAIQDANGLTSDVINIGQVLVIP